MNNELIQTILGTYLLPIVGTALSAFCAWLGAKIKSIYQEKANTELKKKIVDDTVQYVEQVFKDSSSEEKLNQAVKSASEWLQDKGITVTDAELKILIESSVYALTNSFYEVSATDDVFVPSDSSSEATENEKGE
jgi:intergrase/recombinase